jgi:hypothetical protein
VSKKHKQPVAAFLPPRQKVPRAPLLAPNADRCTPAWRVGILDVDGPFGWARAPAPTVREILAKLRGLEAMTWSEILRRPHDHPIAVGALAKSARDRLAELRLDDVDELFQIGLSNKERVFGIRHHHVLDLLWWDPEHKVYPVAKKHT